MRLNRKETAEWLSERGYPIASASLAKKAVDGSGPPYVIWNGRAVYETEDLLEWVAYSAGEKARNTAAHARPARPALAPPAPIPKPRPAAVDDGEGRSSSSAVIEVAERERHPMPKSQRRA